ncbi:hypothetical protein K469DRAFT_727165 [Zopfia rhizophila CBS 207.26]|uniref:Cytochrome P450 n=1 Tax=Zopfia rhizophila CBS 207.26 TaxID=1314779 RepID=A0A6A6E3G6_9PEZI|nr:hypothetical protein K469DRAFT_727165 [Zopfia rhizophila CBS 207.26]
MVSSRSLFLAVYASNGVIRILFLPLCYVFALSPLIPLLIRHFNLHGLILEYIPEDYKTPDILPQVFISLVGVSLATRLISGRNNGGIGKESGQRKVPVLPYWIPGVHHWGNIFFGGESWLRGARDSSITNIFAYSLAGSKHNVILSTPLLDQLLKNREAIEAADMSTWIIPRNAFGLPKSIKSKYLPIRPTISKASSNELFKDKHKKQLVFAYLKILSESLPDLVTFNHSIVDQMPWERVAGLEPTDGTVEVECALFALVNEFLCNAIIPTITGPEFPESYQLLASDLSTFNQSFYALALGYPRWFPIPGLPGASLARKRLLYNLTRFYNELSKHPVKRVKHDNKNESGESETDAETPTPLTELNGLFSQHDLPTHARAAVTLELLHNIASEVVPLAFWTLIYVYSSSAPIASSKDITQDGESTPLEKIREETKDLAEAIQPPSIHPSFPAPPEITFSSSSPPSTFPYLQSCISEARRLHSAPLTTVVITKPVTITETEDTRPGVQDKWEVGKGEYIGIGLSKMLINTSSANYLSPSQYKLDRFLHSPPSITTIDEPQTELTTALVTAFIAGITQLWDMNAPPKKSLFDQIQAAQTAAAGQNQGIQPLKKSEPGVWKIPEAVDGSSMKIPKGDVRVRIRRREGLDGPKTMRKGR